MILRAIFWIGFILVMIPRAPALDLGLATPSVEVLSNLYPPALRPQTGR